MAEADPRAVLETLIRDRGEDYAGLSRLIGRNPAYIQQFIKRGVPKKLDEADRARLAQYFGIAESRLGGRVAPPVSPIVTVDRLDVRASAGAGAEVVDERRLDRIGFSAGWLRALTGNGAAQLSLIRVDGDSMAPTLGDGDEILVQHLSPGERPRDGVVVLRLEEELRVKRLSVDPVAGRYTFASDNPAYAPFTCAAREVELIGRVIWAGRRVV